MTDWKVWRHKTGMLMHGKRMREGRKEVRYAVPADIRVAYSPMAPRSWLVRTPEGEPTGPEVLEVPIWCVRNVQSETEDRPESQWAKGPPMPAAKFLELYEPESVAEVK